MKREYSLIFITNLPSFYKINLYNAINQKKTVFVIFTGDLLQEREKDFFSGEIEFDYLSLSKGSVIKRIWQIICIFWRVRYSELILGGWDSILLWMSAIISPKRKNSVAIESSYLESSITGLKGLLKRFFMRRVSRVYASGTSQRKLAIDMGYKGHDIIITRGVGIFNYIEQPQYKVKHSITNFLYVGRLSEEKNLKLLITVFNKLPDLHLNIIGYGYMKDELATMAGNNISFIGAVDNIKLSAYYQANDVFILPSISEPWGLVVEEALNNGLPVILSNRVGCAEEVMVEGTNGFSFQYDSEESLLQAINRITDVEVYNLLCKNISKMNFQLIAERQVNCYIH